MCGESNIIYQTNVGGFCMNLRGLNSSEVAASRKKYGSNTMPEPKAKTVWNFLLDVFKDKINVILLIMTLVFVFLSVLGYGEMTEAIGIGVVLIIVCAVNVINQMRSQKSTIELRRKASQLFCNVIRNGRVRKLDSTEIVVGDIVMLDAGEAIPADGYIVSGKLEVNNSVLNGESIEVHKAPVRGFKYNYNAAITADDYVDANHVFAGTTVQGGNGVMVVARVGINTENAKILKAVGEVNDVKTALQLQLDKLARFIGQVGVFSAIVVTIIVVVLNLLTHPTNEIGEILYVTFSAITLGLTIFVAAVPEGLPFIIGIITSQNARKMTKANLLAKNPNKIPEAGNIQLLCTDKTGTITFGRMQPVANYLGDGTNIGFNVNAFGAISEFVNNIVLNGRATLDENGEIVGGNSTERALFGALHLRHDAIESLYRKNRVMSRIPFNSAHKFSATTIKQGNRIRTYVMGAPEIILAHSSRYIDAQGFVNSMRRSKIQRLMVSSARQTMRVVATAYYDGKISGNTIPNNLVFISLSIMRDEVRPGVINAVEKLHKSGVQVMMITGDNLETARVIANDSGIISNANDVAINASEFDTLPDAQARKMLSKICVIARATPYTKLRVVELARMNGLCIGMCGDGTNDAPALRAADVGFAMGDSTDVCKGASDIIILDNNFVSITNSILMGRTFMHNVVSFLRFQLPINFMLVSISILFPIFMGFDAVMAVHILIINIIIDSLNSLAFGGEPSRPEYMSEPVMGKNAPLVTRETIKSVLWTTVMCVFIFSIITITPAREMFGDAGVYTSARFALLIILAMLNGFYVRAPGYNVFAGIAKNPMFLIVAGIVFVGTYLCVTFGGVALHLAPMTFVQWFVVVGLSMMIIPLNMLYRLIKL